MRNLLIIALALSLASCGTFRRTTDIQSTEVKTVESASVQEAITVTEKVDTVVAIRPDTSTFVTPIQQLITDTVLHFETDRQSVELTYDPVRKTIRTRAIVKQQIVPVQKERTVVTTRSSDTKTKVVQKDYAKTEQTKKTSPLIPWWLPTLVMLGFFVWLFWPTIRPWIFGIFARRRSG